MKPICLEMKGFGPYGKTASINFQKLENRNLFLITGKTGSGKSTIFDAITFALYGKGNTDDKEGNNFKSDFSKEDLETEVIYTFEIAGKKYTISRKPSQLVRKKRGDGYKSVSEKVYIEYLDYNDSEIVKDRLSDVNRFIKEELLHLDVEQFRHITMIPQGQFRKIITSGTSERENILRKLFDTSIYMEIQEKLKEEKKELLGKLKNSRDLIDRELGKLNIKSEDKLTRDWIEDLKRQKEHLESKKKEYSIDKKRIEIEIERVQKIIIEYDENLKKKASLEDTKKLLEKHLDKKIKVIELGEKLEKLNLAKDFKPYFERVDELKRELQDLNKSITDKNIVFSNLENELEKILINSDDMKKLENSIVDKKIEFSKLVEEESNVKTYFDNISILDKEKKEVSSIRQELTVLDMKIEKTTSEVKSLESKPPINIEYIREKLNNKKESIDFEKEKLLEKEKRLERYTNLKEDIILKKDKLDKLKTKYGLMENNLIIEKENFEHLYKNFIDNIAYMLKKDLKEGTPCPVCGSLEHKISMEKESIEFIDQENIEIRRKNIIKLEKELKDEKQELEKLQTDVLLKEKEISLLGIVSKEEVENLKIEVSKNILEYKSDEEDLEKKILLEKKRVEDLDRYKKEIEVLEKDKKISSDKILEKNEFILKIETLLEKEKTKISNLLSLKEFTIDNYLTKIKEVEKYINNGSQKIEKLNKHREYIKEELQNTDTLLKELKNRLKVLDLKTNEKIIDLESKLKNSKFKDEEEYKYYIENLYKKEEVEEYILNYNNRKQELKIKILELEKSITEYKELEVEDIRKKESELKVERENIEEESNRNTIDLEKTSDCIEVLTELSNDIQELEEKYKIIGELSSVASSEIGSINKKNLSFERYVLSAFLDKILVATNLRFISITDGRYEIRRRKEIDHKGKQSGLDLEVLDNYTGKIRDITTLSGGESFKASLCMALGLSDTVKARAGGIELDTIFIDEGFGTLDNDSLENAMDILVDIQNTGRLVGIISHVDKLKERIEDKIEIITTREGSMIKDFY